MAALQAEIGNKKSALVVDKNALIHSWLRGQDLNLRPLGYEPNELPGCSTARYESNYSTGQATILFLVVFKCKAWSARLPTNMLAERKLSASVLETAGRPCSCALQAGHESGACFTRAQLPPHITGGFMSGNRCHCGRFNGPTGFNER